MLDVFSDTILEQTTKKRIRLFGPDGGLKEFTDDLGPMVYDVHVKPRQWVDGERVNPGRFERFKGPFTLMTALAVGGHYVDGNAKASFKIVQSEGKPKSRPRGVPSWGSMFHEFYRKDNDVWVEKPSSRIDSPGELREITARGIAANKRKNNSSKRGDKKRSLGFVKNMDSMIRKVI